jgi:hypothetical protein
MAEGQGLPLCGVWSGRAVAWHSLGAESQGEAVLQTMVRGFGRLTVLLLDRGVRSLP